MQAALAADYSIQSFAALNKLFLYVNKKLNYFFLFSMEDYLIKDLQS